MPGFEELATRAGAILDVHWQPQGYTVPNSQVYPHQWLWDSCFHAIAWAHLGRPDRALSELRNMFAHQDDAGFVPHMTYWRAPDQHEDFWGRRWTSCITQPPMYGHALAELVRLGIGVDPSLIRCAQAGLDFVLRRGAPGGSVLIVHPWESGCDDSPRWDAWCEPAWDPTRWKQVKGDLVRSLRFDPVTRSPLGNPRFEVASAAFAALVAFNAIELAGVMPDDAEARALRARGRDLAAVVRTGWDDGLGTFADQGPHLSASVRTLEGLLGILPDDAAAEQSDPHVAVVFAQMTDPASYGGACGPAQVHRAEPAFNPQRYWRGGTWPQLNYLLWVAAHRRGRPDVAGWLRDTTIRGAQRSGFAEYWDPDRGDGLGAVPQSWTTLAAVMAGGR